MGFVPRGRIVPERGVTVSQLEHRGLAGRSHGHYANGIGLTKAFPI
ncbi:MAG: hypothetical protein M3Z66_05610 [Chloroflexota bacterium]|nr:hypothetical protein [Chloroflexota bacterium]